MIRKINVNILFLLLLLIALITTIYYISGDILAINPQNTQYNDEVFYLKQVQSVWSFGMPRGYFGYNQSHAIVGTFGSWSVILIYAYAVLCWIFSGSDFAIYFGNVLIFLASVYCLLSIDKMDKWKKLMIICLGLNCIIARNVYSGLTESLFYSALLFYLATLYTNNKKLRISGLAIIILISLMRPYLVIFIPLYFLKNDINKKNIIKCITMVLIILLLSLLFSKYFSADYLTPLLRLTEIRSLISFKNPILTINNLIPYIIANINATLNFARNYHTNFDMVGLIYIYYFLTLILFSFLIIIKIINKKINKLDIMVLFIYLIAYIAIICLYVPYQGSRHVFTFVLFVWAFMIISTNNKIIYIIIFLGLISFNPSFIKNGYNRYDMVDYTLSYNEKSLTSIKLNKNVIGYENTLLLEYGVNNNLYHYMYGVNRGIGINLCMSDYLADNVESIKAKYVLISTMSDNVELYDQYYYRIIQNDEFIIYEVKYGE